MQSEQKQLISLSENADGFSVIDCEDLTGLMSSLVLQHINESLGSNYRLLQDAALYCGENVFPKFREKKNRMLPLWAATELQNALNRRGLINSQDGDFVTDEENLGYPNFYWRLVRSGGTRDVGSAHADKWFWDLGHGSIPLGFRRVKTWVPLLQDDSDPSLAVLPGSHRRSYNYVRIVGDDGKSRPVLTNEKAELRRMICAPVRCGQGVVFHDSLIHAGRVSTVTRISIEWTSAIAVF